MLLFGCGLNDQWCPDYVLVDRQVKSLSAVSAIYLGVDGEGGGSKNCYGRNGKATYISVSHPDPNKIHHWLHWLYHVQRAL